MKTADGYTIKAKSASNLDITLYGEIGGFGIDVNEFLGELHKFPDAKVINLKIHSPGGSMFDGVAIYNSLKAHPASVNGHVEGVAASAASIVLMASDHISMPEDSYIMIHNSSGLAIGDGDDMRDMAALLDTTRDTMVNIYNKKTGIGAEELMAMLKAETWIGADEALELGFADEITNKIDIAAKLQGYERYFKQLPIAGESDIFHIEQIKSVTELEKTLRDAGGFSRKAAGALVARSRVVLSGDPKIDPDETAGQLLSVLDKIKAPDSLVNAN